MAYRNVETDSVVEHWETEDRFTELLDDMETVTIAGYRYSLGYAMKRVDPIAFREAYLDWVNEEFSEDNGWVEF